jgi:diguanylate cyclase (GGDEF)-like protein/PAS domain S-box-containing protein
LQDKQFRRDLTALPGVQENLFQQKEQAAVILASMGDALITTDVAGTIIYMNPTAERITGWRAAEAQGQPVTTVLTLISDATREPIESIPARCIREGRAVDLDDGALLVRPDGTEIAIGDSAAPLRDRDGNMAGVVLVFHDVTERRRVARQLARQGARDTLTGLIGGKQFEERLARVLAQVGMAEHALCYLDLDRFKVVNDACGHEAGDELLRRIGSLFYGLLGSRDTLARVGGDEFGVLLEYCSLTKAQEIAGKLQRAIEDFRYVWKERSFSLGVSIGLVPITAASGRTADVLRTARAACYAAKNAGGNRVHLAQPEAAPEVQQQVESRRIMRLSRAVDEGHFQLYAQATVPLAPERPARPRCEILLRLADERGGVETAGAFLPRAERQRLMPAIDRWVVRETIAVLGRLHRDQPELDLPVCSINLSASSLNDADLVPAVREYLAQHRLPPEALCFEISEAAALGNFAEMVRLISEVQAMGCGIGLDNFGNSLASLAHLKALPVDYVKFGGHAVQGVADDPVYSALVSAVKEIGRIMGIVTIAKEVESETILQKLRSLGVGYAQGHAVAAPEPLVDANGEVALPHVQRPAAAGAPASNV